MGPYSDIAFNALFFFSYYTVFFHVIGNDMDKSSVEKWSTVGSLFRDYQVKYNKSFQTN